jgi:hypothetical protein
VRVEKRRLGGGLLAFVAAAAPVVIQAMGITIPQGVGYPLLGLCAVAFFVGLALVLWPQPKPKEASNLGDDYSIKAKVTGGTVGQIGHNFGSVERRLTPEEKGLLEGIVARHRGSVVVMVDATAPDGGAYSADIRETFERAGWQVSYGTRHGGEVRGAEIIVIPHNESDAVDSAIFGLKSALQNVHVTAVGPSPESADISILVGRRL